MPQQERANEIAARQVVERETGQTFEFADLDGDVDYRSPDGQAALEVTRFTNPILRRDHAIAVDRDHVVDLGTAYEWHVTFDGHPRYDGLPARLYPALHAMEVHRLGFWDPSSMYWWAQGVPTLERPIELMRTEGVLHARASVSSLKPSRLFIYSSGAYSYGGPNAALELLDEEIDLEADHQAKIVGAGADEGHLWIWTDLATIGDFRRALDAEVTDLPDRPPRVNSQVTHLWVVDEPTGRGWRWDRQSGWKWVEV
jgi:hypothetical protein